MIIKRKTRDMFGNWEETPVRIDNPKVIKLYRKRAKVRTLARMKSVSHVPIPVMQKLTHGQPQHPHPYRRQRT